MTRRRTFREKWNQVLNWAWFWTHQRRYRRFKTRLASIGYKHGDIWYSRQTGFLYLPEHEEEAN